MGDGAFEKTLAALPLVTFHAGDTVISAGAKSGQLLILEKGQVIILKDAVELARVTESGAVFGELSALLNQPHTADVRALKDSQFHVLDAELVDKDPAVLLHIARVLARRIIEANKNLVELKTQVQAGRASAAVSRILEKIERVLSVGGASFET